MPYVLLVVGVFSVGMLLGKRAGVRMYVLVAVEAAAATVYYLR